MDTVKPSLSKDFTLFLLNEKNHHMKIFQLNAFSLVLSYRNSEQARVRMSNCLMKPSKLVCIVCQIVCCVNDFSNQPTVLGVIRIKNMIRQYSFKS